MTKETAAIGDTTDETVGLDVLLLEIAKESERLAEQCSVIQWSISAMLDTVDHPDLGAEIHMLQDIDRIQQTLADVAAILGVTGLHAHGAPIVKDDVMSAIRLESLRQRLGLTELLPVDTLANDPSDITWL